jgi:hypothetical protein
VGVAGRSVISSCGRTIRYARSSRVVLAPRCWRYVGDDASHRADNGGKNAVPRGELEAAVKTIRAGKAGCPRLSLWFCRVLFLLHADHGRRPAPGLPCALCLFGGRSKLMARTQSAARTMSHVRMVVQHTQCHSGARGTREPGIHNHHREYGFRARPCGRPRMTRGESNSRDGKPTRTSNSVVMPREGGASGTPSLLDEFQPPLEYSVARSSRATTSCLRLNP